ncbi:hypothetical protein ACFQ9V_08770 [Leifsonia sp. NPDC056665]|uniref:hypothetical protein n=1 Tax=Leifsonia sp. NPDC056665 TaxID=3345901 RepID=UPI00367658FC
MESEQSTIEHQWGECMSDQASEIPELAERINRNLRAVLGNEGVDEVAEKTGLDPRRIAVILSGALPDSFELITFERTYRRQIWADASGGSD